MISTTNAASAGRSNPYPSLSRHDLDLLLQHANNQVTENKHAETLEMIEDAQGGGGGFFGKLVGSVVQALAEPLEALGMDERLAQMIASIALSVALGAVSGGAGAVAMTTAQVASALERVAQGDLGGLASLAQIAAGTAGVNIPPEVLSTLEQFGRGDLDGEGFLQSMLGVAARQANLPPAIVQALQQAPARAGITDDGYDGTNRNERTDELGHDEAPEMALA